jgi:hypothetical protein
MRAVAKTDGEQGGWRSVQIPGLIALVTPSRETESYGLNAWIRAPRCEPRVARIDSRDSDYRRAGPAGLGVP